jgi:hypothetical protein
MAVGEIFETWRPSYGLGSFEQRALVVRTLAAIQWLPANSTGTYN